MVDAAKIAQAISTWFVAHRRNLPWRSLTPRGSPHHAYGVWVMEVMSQQTQIATLLPYWVKWMEEFPTIKALAESTERRVRARWAGLGYYRRCVYLWKGAQFVQQHCDGRLPCSVEKLTQVPGIGPYTAGAIASICFNERVPAVDGNAVRVIARLRGWEKLDPKTAEAVKKTREDVAAMIQSTSHVGNVNEGIMELGALVCRGNGAPHCDQCPLRRFCRSAAMVKSGKLREIEGVIPEKAKKVERREEYWVYVIPLAVENGKPTTWVVQRGPFAGVLAGQWEFPAVALRKKTEVRTFLSPSRRSAASTTTTDEPHNSAEWGVPCAFQHHFSHLVWNVTAVAMRLPSTDATARRVAHELESLRHLFCWNRRKGKRLKGGTDDASEMASSLRAVRLPLTESSGVTTASQKALQLVLQTGEKKVGRNKRQRSPE